MAFLFALAFVVLVPGSSATAFVEPPDPAPTFPPHIGGRWGPVLAWPHIPMSMANLPDGRILTFASNERNAYPPSTEDEYTHAAVWDPKTGSIRSVPHPNHDLFCAGMVTLEGGETFIMGGRNGESSPWVSYFDFHADRWIQLGADEDLNRGRWYPTAVYMGSGKVFIAGGIGGGIFPELWTPGVGFKLLSGIDLSDTILSIGYIEGSALWPLLQLHPDGTIFHHGATPTMNRIDPVGGSGGLGTITDLGPHHLGWFPAEGASVVYDVGKILIAGGSVSAFDSTAATSATRIDVNGPSPILVPTAPMHFPRRLMNEVVLPTGDVLVVGGNTTGWKFSDWNAVFNPEVWDPDADTWSLLNPQDQARTYHSAALLLLDGTVVSGGGGMAGEPCTGTGSPGECGVDHWNVEVFSPPYLFNPDDTLATRPVIGDAPRVARVGRTITVHASPGLSGFSMVRMSSTSHTMNTDQRFLRPATVETSPGVYDLSLHPNENVLVPGYWMLFALEGQVPSIAQAVQIVNDGTPRGPPIEGRHDEVGKDVLFQVEVEDPDGSPITFSAAGLPPGLSIGPATGVVQGRLDTPGLYNVSILAFDGVDSVAIDFQWVVSSEHSESGALTPNSSDWNTVSLLHAYDQPVVVMGPPSFDQADPVTIRVRNVTSTSFEYRVEEWPYLDGVHGSETISYLVVEAGEYAIPGGGSLVAGISTGIDFQNPKTEPFRVGAFAQTPTVLPQIVAADGEISAPASTPRIEDVSGAGFTVRIQQQERDDQSLPAEDVHWIAIESMLVSGLLESTISPMSVDETSVPVAFSQAFSVPPRIFAALQTIHDVDPVTLRHTNASAAGFQIFAQEETSADAEVDHALEGFGWLAIDPGAATLGLLPLFNEPPIVIRPANQTNLRGASVSLFLEASDPEGAPLAFSATNLPPGLSMNASTGEISGRPTISGPFVVTVTTTDSSGSADSATFLWTIAEPLELFGFPTPPRIDGSLVEYGALTNIPGAFDYVWEFGDGSPPTTASTSPTVQHVFPGPGYYVVTLTVTDPASGRTDTRQFTQIVTTSPTAAAPTSSSSIVYEPASQRVWVVNPDNASVSVIDALARTRIAEIAVAAGPRTLAVGGDGRIWVACKEASVVQLLDPGTLTVVRTISLKSGASPYGIVFDPSGTIAFVALEHAGEILRLDGITGAQLASQDVGRNVRHLAVTADGTTLWATRFITPPLPGESAGVPQTQSGGDPIGGEVIRLDAATLAVGSTAVLRASIVPDNSHGARGIPNYLGGPVISPDGTQLLVPSKQDNVMRGLFRDGRALGHDTTVRAISSRIDLATRLEDPGARVDYDDASIASATIFGALGAYAFTTLEGNRMLSVVDPLHHVELGRVDTGRAPRGMAISPDGRTLFVDDDMDRSVSVFDLSALMDFGDVELPRIATVSKIVSEALPPNVLRGKQLFHDAVDARLSSQGYLPCASCHAEGGQDGRTWDLTHLGQGLRNTIGLVGHGIGQGPLHWTGNFDEVQDFENQIRAFGGSGLLSASDFAATEDPLGGPKAGLNADLDALAAYVAFLTTTGSSPSRASDGALTPPAQLGRALFGSERCGNCHRGTQFTDSALGVAHDVGTLAPSSGPQVPFDTPTLRGLWRTAPYLHDGRAPTLEDAIAAHASVSLPPTDLASLAAYLEQIDDAETTSPDERPVVVVTSPTPGSSVAAGMLVELIATATDDEDGDLTASIVWSSSRDGQLGTGGHLTLGSLSIGSHVLKAEVTDSGGAVAEDTVACTVFVDVGPTVAISSPVGGRTIAQSLPVVFAATATDPEDGDLGASLHWSSSLDGSIGSGATFSRSDLSVGLHAITASVTDSAGLPDSDLIMLAVAVDSAPVLTVIAPISGATSTQGRALALIATASDQEEGDLTPNVAWASSRDGPLGSGGSLSIGTLSAGGHVLTASVSDSLGLVATSQIQVAIVRDAAPSVAITAPANGATVEEGVLVSLVATASDPEDGDLSAVVSWSSSRDGALGTGASLELATLSAGIHFLTALVVDTAGGLDASSILFSVRPNAAPNITITSPAGDVSITTGDTLELDATAVDPEEGDLTASAVWESSLDGVLGVGGHVTVSALSVGHHEIAASVSDRHGASDVDQIAVTVPEPGSLAALISGAGLVAAFARRRNRGETGGISGRFRGAAAVRLEECPRSGESAGSHVPDRAA